MSFTSDLKPPILLLAMPQVLDPYFHKSVVLLLHHDDEGSLGFIVNRPTGIRVAEILQGMDIPWAGEPDALAFFGGPVQPQLGSVLAAGLSPESVEGELEASELAPGIAVTQHVSDLERLASNLPARFRLFLGYAGWGQGQLMEEIQRNDWLTAPLREDLVFSETPESTWDAALRSVGVDPGSLPTWTGGVGPAN